MMFRFDSIFLRIPLTATLMFLVTGCPLLDDEDNPDDPIYDEDPESSKERCKNLLEESCRIWRQCYSDMETYECEAALNLEVRCESVTATRNSLYDCREDLLTWKCEEQTISVGCATDVEEGNFRCLADSMPDTCRSCFVFDGIAPTSGDDTDTGNSSPHENDSEEGTIPTGDPTTLCDNVVAAMCGFQKYCLELKGTEASTVTQVYTNCMGYTRDAFRCDAVTAVNANYDTCIDAINGQSCEAGTTEVTECTNVFQY